MHNTIWDKLLQNKYLSLFGVNLKQLLKQF